MLRHTLTEDTGYLRKTRSVEVVESKSPMEQMHSMVKTSDRMFTALKIDAVKAAFAKAKRDVESMERVGGEGHGIQAAGEAFKGPLQAMRGLKVRVDKVVAHMETVAGKAR